MVKLVDQRLDAVFHALADGTRRGLLARLAQGEETVSELAAPFDMSLPAISKHLSVLEKAALISRTKAGRYRQCRIDARGFGQVARWLVAYRDLWSTSFDALDKLLAGLPEASQAARTTPGRTRHRD